MKINFPKIILMKFNNIDSFYFIENEILMKYFSDFKLLIAIYTLSCEDLT